MNTNPLIISALSGIGLPVDPDENTAGDAEYITFNDADNRPSRYANNIDVADMAIVQIHYWVQGDPKPKAKQIRKALRVAGFVILGSLNFYDPSTKYNHTIVEAQIEAQSETQEDEY